MPTNTQLWSKGGDLDSEIHAFTVGEDPELDAELFAFDCIASAAHARMLGEAGLLSSEHAIALVRELQELRRKPIKILPEQEDCHTAIEAALVGRLGEIGKRIHLARSRNDQVLTALRLYLRAEFVQLSQGVLKLAHSLLSFAHRHHSIALPGYTHLQRAMPSSFGMWAQGFAEGLLEELQASAGLWQRLDRCPLGAAAGFGVPLPIQRERSAELLGFSRVQRAPTDCMNARGRHEQALLDWLSSITLTLEKLCWDVVLYTNQEFALLKLPEQFTTGSSIMPQKRNPDVAELGRARCRQIRGWAEQHRQIIAGLPSSYHRDFQLGKAPLIYAIGHGKQLLRVLERMCLAMEPQSAEAQLRCSDELFAAHAAYQKVAQGLSFRDAYQAVGKELANGNFAPDREALKATHLGGLGNLGLQQLALELQQESARLSSLQEAQDANELALWSV